MFPKSWKGGESEKFKDKNPTAVVIDVKNIGLSKYQINWHLTHFKNGGQSFILREDLSQRPPQNLQIFVVREPRTLIRAYSSLTLKDAIKKIQKS